MGLTAWAVVTVFCSPVAARAADAPPSTPGERIEGSLASADTVSCTVRSILGEQRDGGIDKRLDALRKQLSKPPFSAYKRLSLLSSARLQIAHGARDQTKLPTGKVLKLAFKEKLLAQGKVRLRMHLSITPPKAKKYLPGTLFTIADGGTLLVAGDSHKGGTLVVGITCKTQ